MGKQGYGVMDLILSTFWGAMGLFFFALGVVGIFAYGLFVAYRPSLFYQWQSWLYPTMLLVISAFLLNCSINNVKRKKEEVGIKSQKQTLPG